MSIIIIVADGARPDTLRAAMDAGELPAIRRLSEEGGMYSVTTVFPSVTGPAYAPFLLGRFPGPVGLPGLRWYDRTRAAGLWPRYPRSYVGPGMRLVDSDLDAGVPSLFSIAPTGIGALSVINRGLSRNDRIGQGALFALRTGMTHFRGDIRGWLEIDRSIAAEFSRRLREERPAVAFAAFTGIDKTSHATGHDSATVREAMRIVDDAVATIRRDAEADRTWAATHLWIVSDHGHSRVEHHEDLAHLLREWGHRPIAHPWAFGLRPHTAVMVSGNAMAHIYVDIDQQTRPRWLDVQSRWNGLADSLLDRESVDLLLLPLGDGRCEVRSRTRGRAVLEWTSDVPALARYAYEPSNGDPLGIGRVSNLDWSEAYDATITSDYPDGIVQVATLAAATRSGDIILSAARGWDFRARYEPIPHLSSHGALHREHMIVPLILSTAPEYIPKRTTDVMPSALRMLRLPLPSIMDGEPFFSGQR